VGEEVNLVSLSSLRPSGLKMVRLEIKLVSLGFQDQVVCERMEEVGGEEQVLLPFTRLSNDQISLEDRSIIVGTDLCGFFRAQSVFLW
jgi:hypothetical protein